jgi:chromosome segregation ATPase
MTDDLMTDDPKAALAAAVSQPEPVAPLQALGHAARWAALTVPAQVADDDVAAFECVIALDEALSALAGLMKCLPDLLRVASAGRTVSERLAAAEAELARQRSQLATEQARLDQARDVELRAAQLAAERDRLRQQIADLERTQLIERELPALRAARAELEAVVSPATVQAGQEVTSGLAVAARRLLELTEQQQSLIEERNVPLVPALASATEAVARAAARRDDLAAQLAAREQEAGELAAEHQRVLPGLRARQDADRELLAGLGTASVAAGESAIGRVRAELAGIEGRITDAEGLLRPLLLQHARAYEEARKVRGWSG